MVRGGRFPQEEWHPKQGDGELVGQVAIVTGAGRGIGRAIARVLATAGAAVAAVARSEEQLAETVAIIAEEGGRAISHVADVTDQCAVEKMVAQAECRLGPVDMLVNNAGRFYAVGPTWDVDPEEWWDDVETNLRGTFLCTWAVLPGMIARRRGKIINLAGGGAAAPFPYGSGYGSAKAAIVRFSETLAAETGEYGVKAYAIGPGLVYTGLTEYLMASAAGQRWLPSVGARFAVGRNVPPECAGQLVVFLASSTGDGLSGRLIEVDDNLAELAERAVEIQRDDLYVLRLRK